MLAVIGCAILAMRLAGEEVSKPQIAKDLELKAALKGPAKIAAKDALTLEFTLTIVNNAKSVTHTVVKSGDGSECGWREPKISYTAQLQTAEGEWKDVPRQGLGRCGMFDPNWSKDIVDVSPQKQIEVGEWCRYPAAMVNLSAPGRYRIVAHYAYGAGKNAKGLGTAAGQAVPEKMKDVPTFELASKPVEIEVVAVEAVAQPAAK